MKQISLAALAAMVLAGAAIYSLSGAAQQPPAVAELTVEVQDRNPWTTLELNNRREDFQFAIVTDLTGGQRPGIFSKAVERINLLQPEFVMSVGDLIQGETTDPGQWALEWSDFQSKVEQLKMPFFFCAGNHDISNRRMSGEWDRKFGRSYYSFVYRNVLFLVLNTEEQPLRRRNVYNIGVEQQQWARRVLAENENVRWTFVFMHKPAWDYPDLDPVRGGWTPIEDALRGRPYTVFAGHKHEYAKFERRGRDYFMLATTGGKSDLRGLDAGEFDHFMWVTVAGDKPVYANVLLSGIEDENVRVLPDPMPGR
jgi:hypothetical protein